MTEDMFKTVLEAAQAKSDKDGWATLPDGRVLTLYAGHDGVPLTIGKVEALRFSQGVVRARNVKGELFILALSDLFATAIDAGTVSAAARKAGFLG